MIGNGTLIELVNYVVGQPQNDLEFFTHDIAATFLFVLLAFSVVYLIKYIGGIGK